MNGTTRKKGKRVVDLSELKTNNPNRGSKNDSVNNPKSDTPIFGKIEETCSGRLCLPEGLIYLRHGEQRPIQFGGSGFGAVHIWSKHSSDLIKLGYKSEEDVARYVADILQPGASLHSEFESVGRGFRATIPNTKLGVVVVEARTGKTEADIFYSIITAYFGEAKGPRVGALSK